LRKLAIASDRYITAWHAIGGATVPLNTSTYEQAP